MAAGTQQEDYVRKYRQVVVKSWKDESFRQRLLADPKAVLKEHGLPIPGHVDVQMVEGAENSIHLVLPPRPEGVATLSDEELEQVAGGQIPSGAPIALSGQGAILLFTPLFPPP